jgi:hypothetical protein
MIDIPYYKLRRTFIDNEYKRPYDLSPNKKSVEEGYGGRKGYHLGKYGDSEPAKISIPKW